MPSETASTIRPAVLIPDIWIPWLGTSKPVGGHENLRKGLWPGVTVFGITAPKPYQSHFWHVKEEYAWSERVARYRRVMYLS
jgi:hypothetical protein